MSPPPGPDCLSGHLSGEKETNHYLLFGHSGLLFHFSPLFNLKELLYRVKPYFVDTRIIAYYCYLVKIDKPKWVSILETVNPQTAGSVLSGINPAEEDKLIFVFLNYLREADFFVDFAYEGEARGVQNHNPVK